MGQKGRLKNDNTEERVSQNWSGDFQQTIAKRYCF